MKYNRHTKILKIIESQEIETQEELSDKLKESGFKVTQATVSRDIKELRLIKVLSKNGKYKYSTIDSQNFTLSDRMIRVFKDVIVSIDYAGNILVLKTIPAGGQSGALAIDALNLSDVLGTVAGDDTIFVLIRDLTKMEEIKQIFLKLTQ